MGRVTKACSRCEVYEGRIADLEAQLHRMQAVVVDFHHYLFLADTRNQIRMRVAAARRAAGKHPIHGR